MKTYKIHYREYTETSAKKYIEMEFKDDLSIEDVQELLKKKYKEEIVDKDAWHAEFFDILNNASLFDSRIQVSYDITDAEDCLDRQQFFDGSDTENFNITK